jgi:hypothetical protein
LSKGERQNISATLGRLKATFDVILREAKKNKEFASQLDQALKGPCEVPTQDQRGPSKLKNSQQTRRKRNRRASAVVDPFAVFEKGEAFLRETLIRLDMDRLKDIVAEYGMDRSRLAMKWKNSDRLIELILDTVRTRARKGAAFKTPSGAPEKRDPETDAAWGQPGPPPDSEEEEAES